MSELARLVQTEALLWAEPLKVSQQARSQRLSTLPALEARWRERDRPHAPELQWALERYQQVVRVDGSTLDGLIRKMGLLKDLESHPLAGKITAVLDVCPRLAPSCVVRGQPESA